MGNLHMRISLSITGLFAALFFIAGLPMALTVVAGDLSIEFSTIWDSIGQYFLGLFTGESFYFKEGLDRYHNFFIFVQRYVITSFLYLLTSALITVSFSLIIAGWQSRSKREWMKDIIGFLGTIPDFVLVLFLQMGVVFFYQTTGMHLARVATRGIGEHAILLPLITLSLIPSIYLIRSLSERTYDVLTEDYILTSKAKGLRKIYIFIQHVVRNVLPFLKADLHKVFAILMSNLFIVEYLFNISGLSALLFNSISYQFDFTVNILLVLVLLYIVLYGSARLFIVGLERVFAHD